jgi:hypothetical protein
MIEIKRIEPETAPVFKQVRLRALKEWPMAFSSSYAKESLLPDEEWQRRAARWSEGGNGRGLKRVREHELRVPRLRSG